MEATTPQVIKVNVDVAIIYEYSTIAAIFRDSVGKLVHAAAMRVVGIDATTSVAEAMKLGVVER